MFKRLLMVTAMAIAALIAQPYAMLQAQTSQPNVQDSLLPLELKAAVLRGIGAPKENVQITRAGPLLRIVRITTKPSETTAAGRENEGAAIAKVISQSISKMKNHAGIIIIRLEYVLRPKSGPDKVIDVIEYRENAKGVFQHHQT
jgi:hypothetical protein